MENCQVLYVINIDSSTRFLGTHMISGNLEKGRFKMSSLSPKCIPKITALVPLT